MEGFALAIKAHGRGGMAFSLPKGLAAVTTLH